MPKILFVLTGSDHWTLADGTTHPTGFWAEELLSPLQVFSDAGIDVDLASPAGKTPVVDEGSLAPGTIGEEESAKQRKALDALADRLGSTLVLADVDPNSYDAVFVPGGHGPMEDLAVSEDLGRILVTMLDGGKVVSSVCHGPAGLLPAKRDDGSWLFAGRKLTAFTDVEEERAGLADKAPWLLEARLREAGATFSSGEPWAPFVVVDDKLVTGQNPASSTEAAQKVVGQLKS
ncbi:MAG: type 1 glutamine amidotransferase domain-containing protein [Nocardioides sp.]|nr:type 1 glutamine amidotransferase domain-containing protein [Nocardioides sp.]